MLRLGITGGIGSGKSVVCSIFTALGVTVYNADQRSKLLVDQTPALKAEIILAFGDDSFVDGKYNRSFIADQVFGNPEKLQRLNAIIHPYVLNDWADFCNQHKEEIYIVKEAAIMLETDSKNSIDRVVLVHSPLEFRIDRIIQRDGIEREIILKKIASQMPEEEKLKLADEVIFNDGEHSLIEQVLKIHNKLIGKS